MTKVTKQILRFDGFDFDFQNLNYFDSVDFLLKTDRNNRIFTPTIQFNIKKPGCYTETFFFFFSALFTKFKFYGNNPRKL